MRRLLKPALWFVAIGLLLYAGLYVASERLVERTAHANPFHKIEALREESVDWLILGASHAMPLDFADFNATMERETGKRIVNLAATGAGPLYNRFVLEHFLRTHRARNLLYVVDSFAFRSRVWNEDRFADAKLLRRTPFEPALAAHFLAYARDEGIGAVPVLDYVTGFSKINNRERFQRDAWEGEAQFEREYPPSTSATTKRIAYLFPDSPSAAAAALARYTSTFESLLALARQQGMRIVVIKLPVPAAYASRLPGEPEFDAAMQRAALGANAQWLDFSGAASDPALYFDTDHLNRAGVTAFFAGHLKPILAASAN